MQAKIETLKAKTSSGEDYLVYPRTLIKCVTNENGDSLETTLKKFISDNVNEVLDEGNYNNYTIAGSNGAVAASTDYDNNKVRNTVFVTADPGAGASTSYANGSIICVYE